METRGFYLIDNTEAASACQANDIALYAGLRGQELEGSFHVPLPLLTVVFACTAAFAMAATIDCENVHAGRGDLACDAAPRLARPVGLMVENGSGSGPVRRKVGALQWSTVCGFQINGAGRRRAERETRQAEHQWEKQGGGGSVHLTLLRVDYGSSE